MDGPTLIGPCVRFWYVRFVYDGLGVTCVGFSLRRVSRGFDHVVFVLVRPVLYMRFISCVNKVRRYNMMYGVTFNVCENDIKSRELVVEQV